MIEWYTPGLVIAVVCDDKVVPATGALRSCARVGTFMLYALCAGVASIAPRGGAVPEEY